MSAECSEHEQAKAELMEVIGVLNAIVDRLDETDCSPALQSLRDNAVRYLITALSLWQQLEEGEGEGWTNALHSAESLASVFLLS